ncbi:MAG: hypothetical protein IJ727_06770 [Treponema sp.]|nr:hypothetical protein [Treponema sp.]
MNFVRKKDNLMNFGLKNTDGYYDPTAFEAIENVSKSEETENRNIVYICSPLREDIERNQRKARGYCRFVVSKGYIPVSTHLIFPQFMENSNKAEREQAMKMSLELLSRCDELWCFGKKLSKGMVEELGFAKKYQIGIRYFTDTCEEISENEVYHE